MKNCNSNRFLAAIVLAALGGSTVAVAAAPASTIAQAKSPIISQCKQDLAGRLKLQVKDIKVVDEQATTWPGAALGMPETGKMYAQVQTPGSRVTLEARGSQYLYTTSAKSFRYGGPVSSWSYSMLYLQPIENDPNFNGDLCQCSLLGTNSVRIASEVSDYYPQDKGVVIIKRRTSRSTHELLYVRADKPGKEKLLYGALDFGDAAFTSAEDQWAGFVRPELGTDWTIVIGLVGKDTSKAKTLTLPEGVQPSKIAWSGETLMIMVNKADRTLAYETSPKADRPEWKAVGVHTFPGQDSFMLNKSETLEIDQVKDSSKPVVEVARVWFTGDRNLVAKISDFTLRGYELLGPYAFIWGDKGSSPAAYSVDIRTGESISSCPVAVRNIRPFYYPAHNSPVGTKKSDKASE